MMKSIICRATTVIALGTWAGGSLASELDSAQVVSLSHIAGGLVALPNAKVGDEKLALELAKRPSFVVHLTAQDESTTSRLRATGEATGILGKSLYVEQGRVMSLPFADRLVDLIVATDLHDADLTPELKAEWLRVLSPGRGSALAGRSIAAGPGLTAAALKAWIRDIPSASVTNTSSGLWAIFKAEQPPGSDPWSHRCHGADNTQVSNDNTFKAPFLAQWWALPRQEGFWGTTVVSGNGRMFTIRASRKTNERVFLTARSLTSGLVLWQKLLHQETDGKATPHGGYVPSRACAAVHGDTLYLINRDGIELLDGETGEENGHITGPKPGGQVKWMAISGNKIAMLAGDPDVMQTIAYQTVATNPVGRTLAVYDLKTKQALWHETVAGDIDERVPAIRDERLYTLVQSVGVVARELSTGKVIWTNNDPAIQQNFLTRDQKSIGNLLVSQPVTLALGEVILMRAPWANELIALSQKDGSLLWKKPRGSIYRGLTALAYDGLWIGDKLGTIDLKTGEPAQGPKFTSSGCGPTTAVPGYLITCFGAIMDIGTNKRVRNEDIKSPCDIGSIVSEGIMVTMPSECACGFQMKCYRALASAGNVKGYQASPWQTRHVAASTVEPAPMALINADWPTYRHDSLRSGASPATVGKTTAKILWQWKPQGATPYKDTWSPTSGPRLAPDYLATAPVTAGGNVYFASHDGMVRCLKADTGKEVWKFATGAMLFAPPTVWEGRLLVGGGDGRIYGLNASTGKLLWSLMAAPSERRVFWMGHLISTWPITGGVVVKDGVGYAVAGYQADSGLHAYAFDPKTGNVIWERHDAGEPKGNQVRGMSSGGGLAIASNKLWMAGAPAGSFDLKNGDWNVTGGTSFGSEVGMLCNRWVLAGGRRLTELEDAIEKPINSGFQKDIPGVTSLPAWDDELTLFGPEKANGSLSAVQTQSYLAWRTENKPTTTPTNSTGTLPAQITTNLATLKVWGTESGLPASFVLAKDLALVTFVDAKAGHKLTAFNRIDGAKVWSIDLPDQPAMNRIAIDRSGRILVSLCDGSVICIGGTESKP